MKIFPQERFFFFFFSFRKGKFYIRKQIPHSGGPSFLCIVIWIVSQPSTWMAADPSVDTCLIVALLLAVD